MNEIKIILGVHWAFYRKHPLLMLLFILGLSLGSALITAIAGLNQEASQRYAHSSALIADPITHLIKPLKGQSYIDAAIWVELRRLGIVTAQPVLEGKVRLANAKRISLKGVNTLMWLTSNSDSLVFSEQKNDSFNDLSMRHVFVDSRVAETLGLLDSTPQPQLVLASGERLEQISLLDDLGPWAVADIVLVSRLLNIDNKLSYIELAGVTSSQLPKIQDSIKAKARIEPVEQQDFDVLSGAFFFNLTALAMLGYVVAAFLSFNAVKLTLSARFKLMEQLFVLGCTRTKIVKALAIEFVLLAIITAFIGTLGGYLIANALVLDVNRTLMGLYRLDQVLTIQWQWHHFGLGLLINMVAIAVIMFGSRSKHATAHNRWQIIALTFAGSAFFYFFYFAVSAMQALLMCLSVLLVFIVLTPVVIRFVIALPIRFRHPLLVWLIGDSAAHLNDIKISILAILIALGSAIGMQVMVNSFSLTLTSHLEKQLRADLYVRVDASESNRQMLTALPEIDMVGVYNSSDGDVNGFPTSLVSLGSDWHYYQHMQLTSGQRVSPDTLAPGVCIANEPMYLKLGYRIGDTIEFMQNQLNYRCTIRDFFYDYGNTTATVMILEAEHQQTKLLQEQYGFSLYLKGTVDGAAFSAQLAELLSLDSGQIIANKQFKDFAKNLFNNTFKVSHALNGFIMAIALLSICISLLSLNANQKHQLHILHMLGVTSGQLLVAKLAQTGIIILLAILFAVPLGILLGFVLLNYVMPIAFGWTIAMQINWQLLLVMAVIVFAFSLVIALLPLRRITRRDGGIR